MKLFARQRMVLALGALGISIAALATLHHPASLKAPPDIVRYGAEYAEGSRKGRAR